MFLTSPAAVLAINYALGCVAVAWYVVRWRTGQDLRETGSGNVGARNAGRVLGRTGFALIALADIARGWLAMWFALRAGLEGWWVTAAGLAVVAGHIWPVQLGFRGGKGMATAWGAELAACPPAALGMLALFAVLRVLTGSSLVAALTAFVAGPAAVHSLTARPEFTLLFSVLAAGMILTHRSNLVALVHSRRRSRETAASYPPT